LLQPNDDYIQADEETMADALVEALRSPDRMQAMADHARQRVLDFYDWEVLATKLETVWHKALGD
jgi:glycosyltransferase involved in cell wall biosynthesis